MPNNSHTDPGPSRPVAFFDFDDTLVHADSMLHWQRWYARRRKLWLAGPWIWGAMVMRAMGKPPVWMKRAYMATVNRESRDSLESLVRQFSREMLSQCGFAEMLERVWFHHLLGHEIVVVTASPRFYLVHLDDMLPPHRLIATDLRFDGRHFWNMPVIEGRNIKGPEKLVALAEAGYQLPREGTFAYSDHHSDEPLLDAVEFAFAVRPDPDLETLARRRGWSILQPVEPWGAKKYRLAKALWLAFGPLGPRWPHLGLPQGALRRFYWRRLKNELNETWAAAAASDHVAFGVHCGRLERVATRLKGAAPRIARGLVQKPLVNLGHPSQPGMDRLWGTGQSLGLPPFALDALQRMVYQAPECEQGRLVPAPVGSDGLFQTYRVERPTGSDRILKLLLPGSSEAVELDLGPAGQCDPKAVPALKRAWEGLMSEMKHGLQLELDLPRELAIGDRLRRLFPEGAQGIWIPQATRVASDGFEGIVLEAADGFTLAAFVAYLRETRRLRDPKADPTSDYRAFAALVGAAGYLPKGRELGVRLWLLLSRAWNEESLWLTLSGTEDVRVHPDTGKGWRLSVSDFAGVAEFPAWCAHALRDWDHVCPEGSEDLVELCVAMGWQEHQLQAWKGKHRELVEVVWHPLLRGNDTTGFAFEDWRLDGRLAALMGPGHKNESWPIPDPCRRVFRTLWWLRRSLAGVGGNPDDPSPSGIRLRP
ncbi:MAG: haloacid dehalogenase-like hydrolase [Fibrobacteria bacterium]|nr:haloacid dehalogenase-like hydrolase [Fibrobacteria bacterium]